MANKKKHSAQHKAKIVARKARSSLEPDIWNGCIASQLREDLRGKVSYIQINGEGLHACKDGQASQKGRCGRVVQIIIGLSLVISDNKSTTNHPDSLLYMAVISSKVLCMCSSYDKPWGTG